MGKLFIGTIIISALVFVGGVVYVVQKNSQTKANWILFWDDEYQFGLRLPPGWEISKKRGLPEMNLKTNFKISNSNYPETLSLMGIIIQPEAASYNPWLKDPDADPIRTSYKENNISRKLIGGRSAEIKYFRYPDGSYSELIKFSSPPIKWSMDHKIGLFGQKVPQEQLEKIIETLHWSLK